MLVLSRAAPSIYYMGFIYSVYCILLMTDPSLYYMCWPAVVSRVFVEDSAFKSLDVAEDTHSRSFLDLQSKENKKADGLGGLNHGGINLQPLHPPPFNGEINMFKG